MFNLAVLTSVSLPEASVDKFGVLLVLAVTAVLKAPDFTCVTKLVLANSVDTRLSM